MATKRMGRPKRSERDDVVVRLDRAIVAKARLLAAHRGVSVAEVLSDLVKAPVDRAYLAMVQELGSS